MTGDSFEAVDQLAADRVSSARAIAAQLHVGQPQAQRLRDHLAVATGKQPPLGHMAA